MSELLIKADRALQRDLCDHCLGRLFAHVGTGLTNRERGERLRMAVNLQRHLTNGRPPVHGRCWLCDNVFTRLERFAEAAIRELDSLEFSTFLIGTRVDPEVQSREERLWGEVGGETAEPIKAELNREIGKIVESRLGKEVEFRSPDVVAIVDTRFAHVELDIAPLFIFGRYRKLGRGIPQTVWPCKACRGKGCERCGFTGKMYQTSVQEIVGDPLLGMTEGERHLFHGMGREDIDVRMLGEGRPFVIEIRNPVRRSIDFEEAERVINERGKDMVVVSGLRPSTREEVRILKGASPPKTYRVTIRLKGKVDKEKLNEVVSSFRDAIIVQRTPRRVAHRRADRERRRRVLEIDVEEFGDDLLVLRLTAEAGTYVKELVHGDEGRTHPNLAGSLGVPCEVENLDVITIAYDAGEE